MSMKSRRVIATMIGLTLIAMAYMGISQLDTMQEFNSKVASVVTSGADGIVEWAEADDADPSSTLKSEPAEDDASSQKGES